MFKKCLTAAVVVYVLATCAPFSTGAHAQVTDSLALLPVSDITIVPIMNPDRARFVNFIFWRAAPDDQSALIHVPDTLGWNAPTSSLPQDTLSVPTMSGVYTGDIDRTLRFSTRNNRDNPARQGGPVGGTRDVLIRYTIIGEENFSGELNVGLDYQPGDTIPLLFRDTRFTPPDTLNLGVNVHFSSGLIDSNGLFIVGLEDFEGFHVWRDTSSTGIDLTILGELSKEEAFAGFDFDSVYFNVVIPALRTTGRFELGGAIPGLGNAIDISDTLVFPRRNPADPPGVLAPDEFIWFDFNAFNGFTYHYQVTTFDRDYDVRTAQQGLFKFDYCQPVQGQIYACPTELVSASTAVPPQSVLRNIYAVPNPYRSGSSQFSTPNYHNFPDNKMRFVNVPAGAELRIYTPAGDLVRTLINDADPGTGKITGNVAWDTRNTSGQPVSSGIYIYRVEVAGGEGVFGRIVIIR